MRNSSTIWLGSRDLVSEQDKIELIPWISIVHPPVLTVNLIVTNFISKLESLFKNESLTFRVVVKFAISLFKQQQNKTILEGKRKVTDNLFVSEQDRWENLIKFMHIMCAVIAYADPEYKYESSRRFKAKFYVYSRRIGRDRKNWFLTIWSYFTIYNYFSFWIWSLYLLLLMH